MLGCNLASGKPVLNKATKERCLKVLARQRRYNDLGVIAGPRVVKTAAVPAIAYGVSVGGASRFAVKAARRLLCMADGPTRGRSMVARLALMKYDPGADIMVGPIYRWASAIWDDELRAPLLREALRQAKEEVLSGHGGTRPRGHSRASGCTRCSSQQPLYIRSRGPMVVGPTSTNSPGMRRADLVTMD